MAVVVEPIVTREKLLAVLAEQSEQAALDYKTPLNLGKGNARDVVDLAKDVAAMQAEPDGGYIVIGADDHGTTVPGLTPDLAKHFDDATLRQKLAKYLTEPDIRSAQHEVDGNIVVLIHIAPSTFGWCVFREPGEYEELVSGKPRKHTIFRIGDVFVRHGTRSERWTDADRHRLVSQIVSRRKESWRREQAEELAAQGNLSLTINGLKNMPAAAVTWRLDADAFEQLVTELLRRDDDIPLRQLLTQAVQDAADLLGNDEEELRRLLDRLTAFAALAIQYEREAWTERVVTTLERVYELGGDTGFDHSNPAAARLWLDIVTRVYALGALAVRSAAWTTVKLLADRRPEGESFAYYGSWRRHSITMASRAGIFDAEEKAGLLARAHNTIRAVKVLHPDRPAEQNVILTSLCQFDVYGALVVIGERGTFGTGNFYTNFARYYSPRSTPAFQTIVDNPAVRQVLFDGNNQLLADAITTVTSAADKQDFHYDGWTGLNAPTVQKFVTEHGTLPAN